MLASPLAAGRASGQELVAKRPRHENARIDVSSARRVERQRDPGRRNLVELATNLQAKREFQQVAFVDHDTCDASCGFESSCGCESVCDCTEPSCGIEGYHDYVIEPGCDASGGCDGLPGCGCSTCVDGTASFVDALFPRLGIQWDQLDLSAGVVGFTGPLNFADINAAGTVRRGAGSFGFYEGFNKGQSLGFFGTDLAAQFGASFIQANLSQAGFTNDVRHQAFVTSGLFRRVDYGFQFGVVVDHLYDDWYFSGNVTQLRGELSWVTKGSGTFGFLWSAGVDDDTSTTSVLDDTGAIASTQLSFEAINQYNFFYRGRLAQCGSWEAFIGGSDNDETILGMNLDLPVHDYLMLNTSVNYLVPDDEISSTSEFDESWNVAIGFTFRPGGLVGRGRHHRPLFKVADNGTLRLGRL
ncbi:MAG: DUF6666 family protein [Planctomycetota bacterium]